MTMYIRIRLRGISQSVNVQDSGFYHGISNKEQFNLKFSKDCYWLVIGHDFPQTLGLGHP